MASKAADRFVDVSLPQFYAQLYEMSQALFELPEYQVEDWRVQRSSRLGTGMVKGRSHQTQK